MFGKDDLAEWINQFLRRYGIDTIYAGTIVCLLITLSYWRQFKNWENIEGWRKGLASSALFAAIIMSIFSLLKLFGIISL